MPKTRWTVLLWAPVLVNLVQAQAPDLFNATTDTELPITFGNTTVSPGIELPIDGEFKLVPGASPGPLKHAKCQMAPVAWRLHFHSVLRML